MLGTIKIAEAHTFTSDMHPARALAAFKAAAPYLGIRPNVVHAVDWLFRFTDPVDWQPSSKPIVWPSAAMQQQEMGLGVSQVKNLNRHLVELGLIVMKDSPNGKRYGRRGPQGQIIEAYGFDLSPIASRFAEFQAISAAGREDRARMASLRRRATIARNCIRQLIETAAEHSISSDEYETCLEAAANASRGISRLKNLSDMEIAVVALESAQRQIRAHLEAALDQSKNSQAQEHASTLNISSKGPINWPHITTTNKDLNLIDTVMAQEENRISTGPHKKPTFWNGSSVKNTSENTSNTRTARICEESRTKEGQGRAHQAGSRMQSDTVSIIQITPDELIRLAPRLKPYLTKRSPNWLEIIEAADWLRHDLRISKPLWGDACLAMGREHAAIALAIVSTKPTDYFRRSAGGYFYGMVTKARAGELNLSRTIWGMRNGQNRTSST
jgi:replication initiation protein RepC